MIFSLGFGGIKRPIPEIQLQFGEGAAGKLWIQITGLGPVVVGFNKYSQTRDFRLLGENYCHISNVKDIAWDGVRADYTSEIVGGGGRDRVLGIYPPSDGYPLRFWRLKLIFQYYRLPENILVPTFVSPIAVQASYY